MKRLFLLTMLVAVAAAFTPGSAYADGNTMIEICHIPPGNPGNFHTIRISEKAFSAHLAHGDLGGPCNEVCAILCDDGNACTIDDTGDCETAGCPATRVPVDCNDQNACTADSCNPASGCVNTPRLGEACDDGQVCSGPDTCDANGVCQGPAIANCCLGDEDCSQNPCDRASCNLATNRCGEDPVICNPPDLCTVSACSSETGECVDSPVACSDGETCNPATGACEPASCEQKGQCVVFVTKGVFMGNFGGLAAADAICQAEAAAAGLSGTFRAWLSDSTTNARDRVTQATVPFVRVDGAKLWDNWADMVSGANPGSDPAVDPNLAADGTAVSTSDRAWTGTNGPGTNTGLRSSEPKCRTTAGGDWTTALSSFFGLSGQVTSNPAPNWSSDANRTCNNSLRLYCFEQ